MSSFVVKPETINGVITFLDDITSGGDITNMPYREILAEYHITASKESSLGEEEANLQKFADALWDLNIEAVHQRYPDDTVDKMPGTYTDKTSTKLVHHAPYRYTPTSVVQAYKSLRCLLYQCSEGDVPNHPIFKLLEKTGDIMARQIVSDLPEYAKAKWD